MTKDLDPVLVLALKQRLKDQAADPDAPSPAPRCECGAEVGQGMDCKACRDVRIDRNQPDERTRRALARGNRDLDDTRR